MNDTRAASTFIIMFTLITGCAFNQPIKTDGTPGQQTLLVKQINYDKHGLPEFKETLSSRPVKEYEKFTLVNFENGKPVRSFDIAVIPPPDPDAARPFNVIFDWTGKGFVLGVSITSKILFNNAVDSVVDNQTKLNNKDSAAAYVVLVTAPIVIGTVTGFVIGIADSMKATAEEFGKIINPKNEVLLTYSDYDYDFSGKLIHIMTYLPENPPKNLITTTYHYSDVSIVPEKTEVLTHADNVVRTIK